MTPANTSIVPSVVNLRDLGGLPVGGGRFTAPGRVFRSSHFAELAPGDVHGVAALGLRTVVDLRGRAEREAAQGRYAGLNLRDLHLPIEPSALGTLQRRREAGTLDAAAVIGVMQDLNRRFVRHQAAVYRELVRLVLEADHLPLVFHCTAGKDRTGFGAAVLLLAVGATPETVMADYMRSSQLWQAPQDSEDWALVSQSRPDYLQAAFDEMHRRHGSIDAYLAEALGLDDARRTQLARVMVA